MWILQLRKSLQICRIISIKRTLEPTIPNIGGVSFREHVFAVQARLAECVAPSGESFNHCYILEEFDILRTQILRLLPRTRVRRRPFVDLVLVRLHLVAVLGVVVLRSALSSISK
jgi:hypothetical protein